MSKSFRRNMKEEEDAAAMVRQNLHEAEEVATKKHAKSGMKDTKRMKKMKKRVAQHAIMEESRDKRVESKKKQKKKTGDPPLDLSAVF